MPWIISPSDPKAAGPFKVKNKITGKVKGTHPTWDRARAQQSALYVHAPESFMADLDALLSEFTGGASVGGGQAGGGGTSSANVGAFAVPFPAPGSMAGKRKKRTPMPKLTTLQAMMRGGRKE